MAARNNGSNNGMAYGVAGNKRNGSVKSHGSNGMAKMAKTAGVSQ